MCYKRYNFRDKYFQNKGQEKIFHAISNHRTATVGVLMSYVIDFKKKILLKMKQDKKLDKYKQNYFHSEKM